MKRISLLYLLVGLIITAINPARAQTPSQGWVVFQAGKSYHVQGEITRKTVKKTESAAEAIQYAIDAFGGKGGEVRLLVGDYPIAKPVSLRNEVRLRGSGRGTRLLVSAETGLRLEKLRGAAVAELALLGNGTAQTGILLDDSGDCQVRDVHCQGFVQYGIVLRNNSFLCELNTCKLADNRKANIYLDNLFQGGRGGDFVQNEIKNCITYRGGHGIECNRAIVVNIIGCSVFQPTGFGYYVHSNSNSVLISGSRTYQTESHPVVVDDSHEINISSNIFCWQRGHGIVLRKVSWGTISSNNIIDSGVRTRDGSFMNGIVLEGSEGLQVTANAIFNWGDQAPMQTGISEDGACRNNLIAHNNINYFTAQAVQSAGKGTLVKDNVSEGPNSFKSMNKKPYPDFDTKRIDAFIRESAPEKGR